MNKLKPCPFCTKRPVFWKCIDGEGGFSHGTTVQCEHCGISMSDEYEEMVFALWNDRSIEDDVEDIKNAIRDYHYALDTRQHGGVAQDRAFNKICVLLNMPWVQGAEKDHREQLMQEFMDKL